MSTKINVDDKLVDTITEKPPSLSRFKHLKQKIKFRKLNKLNLEFL